MLVWDAGIEWLIMSAMPHIGTERPHASGRAASLHLFKSAQRWRLCFLPLPFLPLPLPFFLPCALADFPPPIAAAQADESLALFLNRQDATLPRSGMNSLQMLCASPAHGCWPPWPGRMSSERCA